MVVHALLPKNVILHLTNTILWRRHSSPLQTSVFLLSHEGIKEGSISIILDHLLHIAASSSPR
jgi:hypothetical protein